MTTINEFVHIPICPVMYDRANKLERAFYDKKGKEMGIKDTNHDYFVGILGELALAEYLHFNKVKHDVDNVLRSEFGDEFDFRINDVTFDVKTQKFNKMVYISTKIWNKMDFMLYPQQVEKLLRKKIDYAYRVVLNADYSYAHLIGYVKTGELAQYKKDIDMGERYVIPFNDIKAPHMLLYEYHEGTL